MDIKVVNLKEEFPTLTTKQNPTLTCYINNVPRISSSGRKYPAMLICPGGGYSCVCRNREGEPIAIGYLSAGYCAFILEYSVAPECYPTQLSEAAAALCYIRRHADEWHIDTDKIAVNGFSAGGHLAASIGVFWDDPFICDRLHVTPEEIKPNALVLSYPVISAEPSISHAGTIKNVSGADCVDSPVYKKMSLEHQVTENTPPTFLWHTAADELVPVTNTLVFGEALARCNVPFEIHIYPFGSHGLATGNAITNSDISSPIYRCEKWMEDSVAFLADIWA